MICTILKKQFIRNAALSFLLFAFSFNGNAQEMWGINHSNFSGTAGIFLNPATIVAPPYKYDINALALNVFVQNNFFYSPKGDKVMITTIKGDEVQNAELQMNLNSNHPQSAFAHVFMIGPSIVYNAGNQSFGFHTAFHSETDLKNVPGFLTQAMTQKYDYATMHNMKHGIRDVSAAAMSWAEVGFTYGRICMKRQKDFLKAAITINELMGFNGVYADIKSADYARPDTNSLGVDNVDVTYAHAIGTTGGGGVNPMTIQGKGLSTTVGVEYVHNRKQQAYGCKSDADKLRKYKYRVGASLIDIGYIHFNSKDASVVNLQSSGPVSWDSINTVKAKSLNSLDTALVNNIGGSVTQAPFNIWLPMAISAQFDYSFSPHVYGNVSIINRLHFMTNELSRPNQVNVSMRYERRAIETAVNFTLFEYSQPAVGASIRFGCFYFGTDRLLQAVSYADLKSFDVYFGIKFNFCKIAKKQNTAGCPAFKTKA